VKHELQSKRRCSRARSITLRGSPDSGSRALLIFGFGRWQAHRLSVAVHVAPLKRLHLTYTPARRVQERDAIAQQFAQRSRKAMKSACSMKPCLALSSGSSRITGTEATRFASCARLKARFSAAISRLIVATAAHQACVLDCTGRVVAERSFAHTGR
jgi:hypothetical protein